MMICCFGPGLEWLTGSNRCPHGFIPAHSRQAIGRAMTATTARQTKDRAAAAGRLTLRRLVVTLAVLLALLIAVMLVSIAIGGEHINLASILKIILAEVTGRVSDVPPEQRTIIADIRLPRVLMAIVVGSALAVAGAAYQALLRNPLADPGILGITSGAALGAITATVF